MPVLFNAFMQSHLKLEYYNFCSRIMFFNVLFCYVLGCIETGSLSWSLSFSQQHKRDILSETKYIELVLVADHKEVNRTLSEGQMCCFLPWSRGLHYYHHITSHVCLEPCIIYECLHPLWKKFKNRKKCLRWLSNRIVYLSLINEVPTKIGFCCHWNNQLERFSCVHFGNYRHDAASGCAVMSHTMFIYTVSELPEEQ